MNRNRKRGRWNDSGPVSGTEDPTALRLLDEAKELGALENPTIEALLMSLAGTPNDPQLLEMLYDALHPYRVRFAMDPDPLRPYPGPESELQFGELVLGTIKETNMNWSVPIVDLPHMLIVGQTGFGKTHLVFQLLRQFGAFLSFLMLSGKRDDLRAVCSPALVDVACLISEIRISLFTPPKGVGAESWHLRVIELFCKAFDLQFSRTVLHEACDTLREATERYAKDKGVDIFFTPQNLYDVVRGRKSRYAESCMAMLDLLIRTSFGVFECSRATPLEEWLFPYRALLVLEEISDDRTARFLVDVISEHIHQYLVANGPNDRSPQYLLVLDDAHRFLGRRREDNGPTSLDNMYLTTGQAGLRILGVSQRPSELSTPLSQSGIIVCVGGLAHSADLAAAAAALGVEPRTRLAELGKGDYVARESIGCYMHPFAGCTDPILPMAVHCTEQERQRANASVLSRLHWSPTVPLSDMLGSQGAVPAKGPKSASPDAYALASDILTSPWDFVSERYGRLNMMGGAGDRCKREIVDLKWARPHRLPIQGRPLLLEPLPALAKALHRTLPRYGRGGFLSAYLTHITEKRLKATAHTDITREKYYGSKAVDVVALDSAGELIGVEVTVSLRNLVDNLEKDFSNQPHFKRITVLCLSQNDARQAKRAIASAPGLKQWGKRIDVATVGQWL